MVIVQTFFTLLQILSPEVNRLTSSIFRPYTDRNLQIPYLFIVSIVAASA